MATQRIPMYRDRSIEIFWSRHRSVFNSVRSARNKILARVCPTYLRFCNSRAPSGAMTIALEHDGTILAGLTACAIDTAQSTLPRLSLSEIFVDTRALSTKDFNLLWRSVLLLAQRIGVGGIDMLVPENAERAVKVVLRRVGKSFETRREGGVLLIDCRLA